LIKEGNVLGAGPSRISYIPNGFPSIGVNYPWTNVEWTLFFDVIPINVWLERPEVFDDEVKFVISEHCYNYFKKTKQLDLFKHRIYSVFSHPKLASVRWRGSSGHYAAEWMISQGYNKLNLYGMDNYFGDLKCLSNYSHDNIGTQNYNLNEYSDEELIQRGKDWQLAWKRIIKQNKHVEFNFVR